MATSRRTGNYSTSARAVVQASDQIFSAAMEGKPDFTKIAQEAIKGRSKERQAATVAEGRVAKAGIDAFKDVTLTKIDIDSDKAVNDALRPARRMAGIVGGLGAIAGGYVMMEGNKKDKADREELRGMREAMQTKADQLAADQEAQYQKKLDLVYKQRNSGNPIDSEPTAPVSQQSGVTLKSAPAGSTSTNSKARSGKSAWGALSSVIRGVEGTAGDRGYTTRFGGAQFSDMSKHPNIKAPTPWGTSSEAAGAYQFMKPTWDEAKSALGLTDFSPASQEKAGRFLTQRRGVDPDQRFTTFESFSSAISKLSPEWAGLPNSDKGRTGYHGQANADMNDLWNQYQNYFN